MANNKFKAAVKKAKGLYKTGRYKTFALAVKAAYNINSRKPAKKKAAPRRKRKVSGLSLQKRSVGSVKRKVSRKAKPASTLASAQLSLGQAYASYVRAGTIRDTKAAEKRISERKKRIRTILKSK